MYPVSTRLSRAATDALLVAAGRGDLDAFATLYDRTAAVVFGMLRPALGPRAESATMQVYLQLWRAAPGFDPPGRSAYTTLLFITRRALAGPVHGMLTAGSTRPEPAGRTPGDATPDDAIGGAAGVAGVAGVAVREPRSPTSMRPPQGRHS